MTKILILVPFCHTGSSLLCLMFWHSLHRCTHRSDQNTNCWLWWETIHFIPKHAYSGVFRACLGGTQSHLPQVHRPNTQSRPTDYLCPLCSVFLPRQRIYSKWQSFEVCVLNQDVTSVPRSLNPICLDNRSSGFSGSSTSVSSFFPIWKKISNELEWQKQFVKVNKIWDKEKKQETQWGPNCSKK